jgi:hypothetical protein
MRVTLWETLELESAFFEVLHTLEIHQEEGDEEDDRSYGMEIPSTAPS